MKDLVFKNAGARALGECALVPDPSPIFSVRYYPSLILFLMKMLRTTWLLVQPMATSVVWWSRDEREELEAAGLNRSDVHVDFMIGSNQMDIDGIREDGTRVPLFRNGDWAN